MDTTFCKNEDPIILQQIIDRILMGLNTAIPGTIKAFNPDTQTATVSPNIKAINHTINGETFTSPLPELIYVPCFMPGSSSLGLTMTIPITKGDQCLIIFSQRSIDNWLKWGGVQSPVETLVPRHHSLSDGIALVGLYPTPQKIQNYNPNAIEIRNKDKTVYIKVSETEVVAKAPVIILDGNVIVTGTLSGPIVGGVAQPVETAAGIEHSGKTIDSGHAHSGVTGGTGNSGGVA